METPQASSASLKHTCQVVDKVTVFLHGPESMESFFYSQIIPAVLTRARGRKNHLSRMCLSLLMFCRYTWSLGVTNPLSWPLSQEKQLSQDWQTFRGRAALQKQELSLPRTGELLRRSSISTRLLLGPLKLEASQDSPSTSKTGWSPNPE